MAASDVLAARVVLSVGAASVGVWAAGALSSLETGHGLHAAAVRSSLSLLVGVVAHPGDPRRAWPTALRRGIGPAPLFYVTLLGLALPVASALWWWLRRRAPRRDDDAAPASWARPNEMRGLLVSPEGSGRLVIGRSAGRLLAVEEHHSLLVLGPTQSGKTSGLAIPALLEWPGPVLASSVKGDLLAATLPRRSRLGRVLVFDPQRVTNHGASWSPLAAAADWGGARRIAASLCAVARSTSSGLDDAAFWYATAEKLLAPLLFAAASAGATMGDVVRWVDSAEVTEVLEVLERTGSPEALWAARASFSRDDRQLSSVYTTTETVLAAFADPDVRGASSRDEIDPASLFDGGAASLFVVSPAHHQARLAPVFVALVTEVLERAFDHAARSGGRLDPGLLIVLDEAANVAPLPNLDVLASTAASHGIELVTVFQDLAQIESRYGPRSPTVVNNHRAKLVLSGVGDPATLELMSTLIGEQMAPVASSTLAGDRTRSTTWSVERRRLAPADWLRRLTPGEGVLIHGHLPPCRVRLRPYFSDRALRLLADMQPGRRRRFGRLGAGRRRR